MILPDEKIVIVGAGCFGMSTAYHLLKRGFTDVTVIDRSKSLPAPDGASNDYNRIVRSSYADMFYAQLARDAIHAWKDREEWGDTYHESGVLVLDASKSDVEGEGTYVDASYVNDQALGAVLQPLQDGDAIRAAFPSQVHVSAFANQSGYLNRDGGWANAAQGMRMMTSKVVALNGKVLTGKDVCKIIRRDGKAAGVECRDGTVLDAALLVIATGSWSASAFPELELSKGCIATGQCLAMINLEKAEADLYRDCPVVLHFASGFYVFPPTDGNMVKIAMHAAGYSHTAGGGISTPFTITSDPERGLLIPKVDLQSLRANLRTVYPDLAGKPITSTRLCWYNDTPDEDWIIGHHPSDSSLIIATGDSGHAYKFLPVIGRLVADAIQGTMEPDVISKFAVNREITSHDPSRSGQVVELDLQQFYVPADLLPEV